MTTEVAPAQAVTIVTQTRVLPGKDQEFAGWQQRVNTIVEGFAGFLGQTTMPPAPPAQVDWVIVQRFGSMEEGQQWMRSPERQQLLAEIEPILVGTDDIHFFAGQEPGPPATSVSAVISTRVVPGREQEYRAWQRRIAAAESTFAGFQGTRLEPPVPGVQEDWAAVVRFDSDTHLQAWLDSDQRQHLLAEAAALGAASHVRKVQSGFENWFTFGKPAGAPPPPAWKQNMVILLVLYPVVFLFGALVQTPLLLRHGVPFWLALFLSNAFSVVLMGYWLTPWVSRRLAWWLTPQAQRPAWREAAGLALVVGLYCLALAIFSRFP